MTGTSCRFANGQGGSAGVYAGEGVGKIGSVIRNTWAWMNCPLRAYR
jgi:hypothetical protein